MSFQEMSSFYDWNVERKALSSDLGIHYDQMCSLFREKEWETCVEQCKVVIARAEHIIKTSFDFPKDHQDEFNVLNDKAMKEHSGALVYFAIGHVDLAYCMTMQISNIHTDFDADREGQGYFQKIIDNAVDIARKSMSDMAVPYHRKTVEYFLTRNHCLLNIDF